MPVKFVFQDPRMQTWMMLHQTASSMAKCEEKRFSPLGLTTQQHAILMAIKLSSTPPSLIQIADWVDRHANSITLIVDRMEKSGLVKRTRNIQDRRSYNLIMTAKGEKYLQSGLAAGLSLIQEILSCLSDAESQKLFDLLDKIRTKAIEQGYEKKTITEIKVAEIEDKLKPGPL
jgi:DNA-binding MarR family transcriptional regulator